MTTRRINWTERRRITKEQVRVSIDRSVPICFKAELDISAHRLPPEALVVIEAYRQTTWKRFDFGTVSLIRAPDDCGLAEFDPPDGVQFRVKILGTGALDGRILAEADRIQPANDDEARAGRQPLLIPRGDDLGSLVWKLELDETADPELLVNNRLEDWRSVARSPEFMSLVFPHIFRQILEVALTAVSDPDDPADTSWHARWVRFGRSIRGAADIPSDSANEEERSQWIEDVVQAFARRHTFFERFEAALGG